MSQSVRVGIVGASGRTGSNIIAVLEEFPQFTLGAAIVSPESTKSGQEIAGGRYTADLRSLRGCDVVIDFSTPLRTPDVAAICAAGSIPLVVGTTGFSAEGVSRLTAFAASCPILIAPNTSLGIFVLRAACQMAQDILGADFDVRVLDIHHGKKRDAPSGTARLLAADLGLSIAENGGANCPQVAVLRGGDEPGHHSVYFLGSGDRLEFSHVVHDRRTFARGALRLALRLPGMPNGVYSVDDLYSRK